MPLKIFISYSTKNLPVVQELRAALVKEPGVEVFVAEFDVPPGAVLSDSINAQLRTCDIFCVLWGRDAKESGWVQQEIGIAAAHGKLIVPFVLDRDVAVPGFISDRKYIPAFAGAEKALADITQLVRDVMRQRETAKQKEESQTLVFLGALALILFVLSGGKK